MKTLDVAQFGLEELSTADMINNHGGGDNTSILNIGSIVIADLVDVSGNSLFNGDNVLFSGNDTSANTSAGTGFSFSFSR